MRKYDRIHDTLCHVSRIESRFLKPFSGGQTHMRADRLLSILLLLQAHRQLTSRNLANRLEVSERTIHRDMEALSGAGIPVVAERGRDSVAISQQALSLAG
jgi:predicted DNA-binding transcriptional regulator YafY